MISTTMHQGSEFNDYYKLLGIKPNANTFQMRRAFIQKAKQHHPDVGGSTELMRLLNVAYNTLNLPTSKAAYDRLHRYHTGNKESEYTKVGFHAETKLKSPNSDEYIDWFIDTIYAEYNNANKSKLTFGNIIKKVFNNHF